MFLLSILFASFGRWHSQAVRQKPAKLPFPSSNLGATFNLVILVLYLVATPIGNLADISFRAVDILKKCDYILCEDTRHSRILLDYYGIRTALKSFHRFNEASAEDTIIADLKAGKSIALISDAGTPLISDPGQGIVMRCQCEEIEMTAIPGPCAAIEALILSGFPTGQFQFFGFLPKKEKELQAILSQALFYPGTTIAYESPYRIDETLKQIARLSSERKLSIARELTKMHEEVLRGTSIELLEHFKKNPPRGELVLLISPPVEKIFLEHLSLQKLIEMFQKDLQLSKIEAIKMAAQMRHLSKREVYKHFIKD
jgi:16S rRNA (cytidine1402-2'-O)-methyltransferase